MILAGDIGGTNTRLGLFEGSRDRPILSVEKTYPSGAHSSLEAIVRAFLEEQPVTIRYASFGIAGPVFDNRCRATNLPWELDGDRIASTFNMGSVSLINDLVANAYGTAVLDSNDLETFNRGDPETRGNEAIISPGTGLGQAGIYWDGSARHPFPSEGGHSDFAPRNDIEWELLGYLRNRYGRVSYERVLSGPGLLNTFRFLRDTGRGDQPEWLAEEMDGADPAAVIARAAFSGRSPLCAQTVDLFIKILGAEAGNLALKVLAVGGVWIGGGIMARWLAQCCEATEGISSFLPRQGLFMQAFTDKGRFKPLMEKIPVRVILNDKTALLGAASHAFELENGLPSSR
jgi:glucokinase